MTYSQETRREYRKLFEKAAKTLAQTKGVVLEEKKDK